MNVNRELFLAINNLSLLNIGFLNFINIFIAITAPYLYAILLVITYLINKKRQSLKAFYVAVLGLAINFVIGLLYYHPRPFAIGLGHDLIAHASDSSFPSDHATLAFSIAFGFLYSREKLLGYLSLAFAIIVGFARVFVGVHFPFDIVGSFFVSLIAITIVNAFNKYLEKLSQWLIDIQNKIFKFLRLS